MANKKDSGVSLKTPQQVWDYYCLVGNFNQEPIGEDAETWITGLFSKFSEEEFEIVIRNSAGSPAYAVFDETFFRTVLDKVHMEEKMKKMEQEMENMKSLDRSKANSLDLLTQTVANTMTEAVQNATMDNLKEDFQRWVESTYGPTYKRAEQYIKPDGNPIEGVVNEKFQNVLRWVTLNRPVMLTGPAGCGKNVLAEQIAEYLGMPIIVLNRVQDAGELQGYNDINGKFVVTPFIKTVRDAAKAKKDCIVVFDELDGADANAMVAINDAISSRKMTCFDTSVMDLHHVHFVATGNTFGTGATEEYVGRNQLDAATLNRFRPVVIDYDPKVEESICADKGLLKFYREFRNAIKTCGMKHIISYRNLKDLVDGFEYEKDNLTREVKVDIIKETLVENLTRDDLSQIYPKLDYTEYRDIIESLAEVY